MNNKLNFLSAVVTNFVRFSIGGLTAVLLVVQLGCASSGDGGAGPSLSNRASPISKIQICKAGDQMVASSNQCIQDDAACYQISNGQWCTGPRGNVCPAGSTELAIGVACPTGSRCIRFGESLTCKIN